jgi:hypothetical protein
VPVEVPPSPNIQKELANPIDVLLKLIGSLIQGCTFDAVKAAVGLYTVMVLGPAESTHPIISDMRSLTRYTPDAVYICVVTDVPTNAVLPSPKSHRKLLSVAPGTSVEVSVKVTESGQHPVGGTAIKPGRGSPTIT